MKERQRCDVMPGQECKVYVSKNINMFRNERVRFQAFQIAIKEIVQ